VEEGVTFACYSVPIGDDALSVGDAESCDGLETVIGDGLLGCPVGIEPDAELTLAGALEVTGAAGTERGTWTGTAAAPALIVPRTTPPPAPGSAASQRVNTAA
jgi:hypothetical protein